MIHADAHPSADQEHEIKTLFGRKVAIDASMSIYQFLIAVRQKDGELLTNDAGETTRYVLNQLRHVLYSYMTSRTAISWVSSTALYVWSTTVSNLRMSSTASRQR